MCPRANQHASLISPALASYFFFALLIITTFLF